MHQTFVSRLLACTLACLSAAPIADAGEIVIENPQVALTLSPDATWHALVDKRTGKDWCFPSAGIPLVEATIAGRSWPATGLAFDGRLLRVTFDCGTALAYEVTAAPHWIVFTLRTVSGPRPERLVLLRAPVAINDTVARTLCLARNDDIAVCLLAANMQTDARGDARAGYADLRATTQDAPGPKMEGAAVALLLAPMSDIRTTLHEGSVAFGLPTNVKDNTPAKEFPEAKQSYWFLSFGEQDVDKVIDYCKQSGFRQVMLSFGAWSTGAGHYLINTRNYPRGVESLKATIDRLHAEGILVGMHTFASKVKKTDPYVTPVPDHRFWKDMVITLAADIDSVQTEIRVKEDLAQWPGSPIGKQTSWEGGVEKHQEVIIGTEIIRYESIGPAGKYDTFLGCQRGAWKTAAAQHAAGATGYHFGVDGCINGYIIDQETSLIDEVTTTLADIFNTCGFDMVYFDGGEDVDRRRFDYYVTKNQALAMSKFTKRPVLHMGTCMTHRLWHSFSRAGTVDHYMNTMRGYMIAHGGEANPQRIKEVVDGVVKRTVAYDLQGERQQWHTVKEHINRSVQRAVAMQRALMPSELGWFGIWPKNMYSDGLQLDEVEYLMVKSLAYNQPLSLQTGFSQMEAHPLTPQILEIVKTYETWRLDGPPVDQATLNKIRKLGRDFILIQAAGRRDLVEVSEVPDVARSDDRVRAFVGAFGNGTVATTWHTSLDGSLVLDVLPANVSATTFSGTPMDVTDAGGATRIPVNSSRTTLFFDGLPPERAQSLFETGSFEETPPCRLWIQAESCHKCVGNMVVSSDAAVDDPQALGNFVVCTGKPNPQQQQEWFCEYTVNIPRKATWTLYARVRYPSGQDESFWFVPHGGDLSDDTKVVLGNCGRNGKHWHWTGRGSGST